MTRPHTKIASVERVPNALAVHFSEQRQIRGNSISHGDWHTRAGSNVTGRAGIHKDIMHKYRLTVKSHRPAQWAVAIILMSMLVATLTWFLLDHSHWSLINDKFTDSRMFQQLQISNNTLAEENRRLREKMMMMEQTASVDQETMLMLQNELKTFQEEIYLLKGELEFYQGIMDSARDVSGLSVQGLHIDGLPQARSYNLKLVLTHVAKSAKVAEGKIKVLIAGSSNGKQVQLRLEDITLDESLELDFAFRNFNRFETRLELPEGFHPGRVIVQLRPKDRKLPVIRNTFDWPATAGAEKQIDVGT